MNIRIKGKSGLVDTVDTLVELSMIKDGMNVLDIGCGPGNWMATFINMGLDISYHGIDVNKTNLECAIARAGILGAKDFKFSKLNVSNEFYNKLCNIGAYEVSLPVKDSWANLVICHSLFTHLELEANSENYMKEIKRILKVGGYLWITFFQSPPNDVNYGAKRTVYRREFIDKLMEGFTIIHSHGGESTDKNDQLMMGAILK